MSSCWLATPTSSMRLWIRVLYVTHVIPPCSLGFSAYAQIGTAVSMYSHQIDLSDITALASYHTM